MKYKHLILLLSGALLLLTSCGGGVGSKKPTPAIDSVSYAIGVSQGTGLKMEFKRLSMDIDEELMLAGIRDAFKGDSLSVLIKPEQAGQIIQNYLEGRAAKKKTENLENGRKFLEENAKKAGIITTASGLQYRVEKEGAGIQPRSYDTVEVNYRGKLIDGKEFESSYERNKAFKCYLSGVIKGWTEGIQLMKVGSKYTFYIPTELAYGEYVHEYSPFEANVPLIFEIELVNVIPGKEPKK